MQKILRKGSKNTQKNYTKMILMTQITTKVYILESEAMWALGSITTNKANGSDGSPVELFQILNDESVKVLHSICKEIWKTEQWPQNWKRSIFISVPKKVKDKKCSNYCTIALISHTCKEMLKILQVRFQQCMN